MLRPGYFEVVSLLFTWYLRKTSTILLGLGLAVLALARNTWHLELEEGPFGNPGDLLTAAGVLEAAILLRLATWFLEKGLAYPLVRTYDKTLPRRGNVGRWFGGTLMDQWKITTSFALMRFSHYVRQESLRRLGPIGSKVGLLDPILDVINIAAWTVAIVVLVGLFVFDRYI